MKHAKQPDDLRHLKNHEINFIKWDNCINNAHNGSIYAFSWYLDIICEEWEAIVQEDYQAVMPLLIKKRSGIKHVYNTILANQLGVFSTEILDEEMTNTFLRKVNQTYKVFSVNLNKFNRVNPTLFRQKKNNTYEFDLISNYNFIRGSYSEAVFDNIERAKRKMLNILRGLTPGEFMDFIDYRSVMISGRRKKETVKKLGQVLGFVINHGLGDIYAAFSEENHLCAAVFFLKSKRKASVLYSGVTREGIRLKAMELLIDRFIQKNAEKNITLSFENLVVPDREKFFSGFGAGNYHFTTVKSPLNPLRGWRS
jgi:hypothetical protein